MKHYAIDTLKAIAVFALLAALTYLLASCAGLDAPDVPHCSYCGQWYNDRDTLILSCKSAHLRSTGQTYPLMASGDTIVFWPADGQMYRLVQHGDTLSGYFAKGLSHNAGASAITVEFAR